MAVPHRGHKPRVELPVGSALRPPEVPVYRHAEGCELAPEDTLLDIRAAEPMSKRNQVRDASHRSWRGGSERNWARGG
jgi:hypothetical protein